MATFTWLPSIDSSRETTPRVRKTPFGDGYVQRVADGINNKPKSWALRFAMRPQAEADAIDAFLDARGGSEAFDWTDPNGHAGRWVCESWTRPEHGASISSISATFEEVFGQ